jgi:hypothetical protein
MDMGPCSLHMGTCRLRSGFRKDGGFHPRAAGSRLPRLAG